VTYEEFKSLIDKIDREVVAQHTSFELAQMTRALFDFVESGKMVPQVEFEQQTLPINAAIVFFEDKQLANIRARLELERDQNRVLQITVERLADIIEIVRVGKEDATASPIVSKADTADEIQAADVTVTGQPAYDYAGGEIIQEQEGGAVAQAEQVSETSGEPPVISAGDEEKIPVSIQDTKQKEILGILSEKERRLVIKKIFDNDEPAFQAAIAEISLLETWKDVTQYLELLFRANNVNPFSKVAVQLTDKLSIHFHSSFTDQ